MALDLLNDSGCALEDQKFTWTELVPLPLSKLDDDAMTRARALLMASMEAEAMRFSHVCARNSSGLRATLAKTRRIEQHQRTLLQSLSPPDLSPLEVAISLEQMIIEVTAVVITHEPDSYISQVYRFGLVEHVDQLYRLAALYDRLEGKDPNTLLQSYSDIRPGRPCSLAHRDPEDDLREPYANEDAVLITRLNATTMVAIEHFAHEHYLATLPRLADPLARQLFSELASIQEQHVTQCGSVGDPDEVWLEKWLIHEAAEALHYHQCVESETNSLLRPIWERFLQYELGHLAVVRDLVESLERRDLIDLLSLSSTLPTLVTSQREVVREILRTDTALVANGKHFVPPAQLSARSLEYRAQLNEEGSPSETVAAGYVWRPGGELAPTVAA